MSLELARRPTARVPEPLDRVKALVCKRCWETVFDTEEFERFGRREVESFEYTVPKEELELSIKENCGWCMLMRSQFRAVRRNPLIKISHVSGNATPKGSNLYLVEAGGNSFLVNMSTDDDNLAAEQVTARKIETNLSPPNTRKQITEWLIECAGHQCCPEQIDLPLPTRLIDVTTLQLITTKGQIGKYAALSYCWGNSSQTLLQSFTLKSFSRRLNFDGFPQTIKDAILVTRSISIPYLWVDALCIVQDSEEDKAHEIGLMAQVFGNAYITIVASSANSASEGFLETRNAYEEGVTLPFRIGKNCFGSVKTYAKSWSPFDEEDLQKHVEPVNKRAWTLQEQLIARRLLMYEAHTLQWRCRATTANLGQSLYHQKFNSYQRPKMLAQFILDPKEAYRDWHQIVEEYSSRAASHQSDKLPAIAALAERMAPALGKYHAGVWEHYIIEQLCWQQWRRPTSQFDLSVYRAPSWSWASVDGWVRWLTYDPSDACCTFVRVVTAPKNKAVPYGEVSSSFITLRGKLLLVSIMVSPITVFANTYTSESPSMRFLKTYFQQSSSFTTQILETPVKIKLSFEEGRQGCSTGLAYLLQLSISVIPYIVPIKECKGIILVPAGPHTFRRIGFFHECLNNNFEGISEEKITIV
ncbi:heterokaryon incompatibility protein-domain-containing protein [Lophiotrema nucula]|uniref:Heterokaryon incompatibility protein-domain-containing protein n=1 Tax=Lophiotrema nucula TaxID=690887 RepID=A0A6A5ZE99_9PLEO|nr:heterokaryon incompatibility protein-domain-containing protein [Lophiotrema nucula]